MQPLPLIQPQRPENIFQQDPFTRLRGAPVKLKNNMVKLYNLKNTKGKKFKFSFILQILIGHLQHLVGNKAKVRYSRQQ